MNDEQILDDLCNIVIDLIKRPQEEVKNMIRPDADLKKDLGIDSVESLDFLNALESRYEIHIPDVEAAELKKVADVISLIRSKLK